LISGGCNKAIQPLAPIVILNANVGTARHGVLAKMTFKNEKWNRVLQMLLWPVLLLVASCAAADYRAGIEALNRGDHGRAFNELEPLAKSGNSRAQWALGYMYRRGLGVPKDQARAEAWRERAVQGTLGKAARNERGPQDPAQIMGRGSGFVVSERGQVVTNHHVVARCGRIRVRSGLNTAHAKLKAADDRADLALLEASEPLSAKPAVLRRPGGAALGEEVVIAGYPLQGVLSHEMHVLVGVVSALAGPRGDARLIQIGTRVQPGNSGGPVLDRAGRVIGVVAGVLPPAEAERAGAIGAPQISFAIRGELISSFLDRTGVRYRTGADAALDTKALARRAEAFTVLVECLR
jgi:S1-C subfamily serine protease